MAAVTHIKKRIESTKNIGKITKTMELVAATKMKHFQQRALQSRAYVLRLAYVLAQSGGDLSNHPFGEVRTKGKTAFVLLTSDKGLCGALNSRLVSTLFRSEEWTSLDSNERLLITVGKKGQVAARAARVDVHAHFDSLDEEADPMEVLGLLDTLLSVWREGVVKSVYVVAPQFVNAFSVETRVSPYLPFTSDALHSYIQAGDIRGELSQFGGTAFWEPDEERAVSQILEQLLHSFFVREFFELKASEYSSRLVAMKSATDAAGDLVDTLNLQYNKARQGIITQQLAELAAGMEALV